MHMDTLLTVRLPRTTKQALDRLTKSRGTHQSDIVRDALRQYFARAAFRRLRERMVPEAEKCGLYTDEDVFRSVS